MDFLGRMLLLRPILSKTGDCDKVVCPQCPCLPLPRPPPVLAGIPKPRLPPLPPLPPRPPRPSLPHPSHQLSPVLIISIALLSSAFLLVSYYAIIVKYCANWRAAPAPAPAAAEAPSEEGDFDEAAAPVNYIWYVTTVGLDEAVIRSIAVCRYRKGEGLIEGTECSVCLSEFREDEILRLLPKCSHAFHIPCIDTWLRSHVNCPLCRANVLSNPGGSSPPEEQAGLSQEGRGEPEVDDELQREGIEVSEAGSAPDCAIRVLSDLGRIDEGIEEDPQPVRRSVSMDSPAAAMVCLSLSTLLPADDKGESSGGNRRLSKVRSLGCRGGLFFKGPVAMKRSFSSGRKFSLSTSSRNRNSLLPL